MMRYLIGIDDTDSLERPGTAILARRLVDWLRNDRMAEANGITRHQLSTKKHIPFTAHNSAVCISVDTENMEGVWETTRDFLTLEADPASNPGLCLASWEAVSHDVIEWGHRAKKQMLALAEFQLILAKSRIRSAALQ